MTRKALLVAFALVALLVAGFFTLLPLVRQPVDRLDERPDIVLITIDTLRADRVGAGLTPSIDALAAAGWSFDRARATAPLTLPSHVTMMTGMLPPAHGVRENGAVLRAGTPTLARVLRDNGYRTGAFVGAYVLDRRFGLADGFDVYDDNVPRDPAAAARLEAERRGGEVVDAALSWLRDVPRPFFLWIHLYDPHAPYTPPAEFLAKAGGHAYNGEVAYADAQVGRIVDALRQRGAYDGAVIALAGDHGEGLGDHGEATHGMLAYDATLRVPLILIAPRQGRGRLAGPVSLADLPGTLLTVAHMTPPADMSGVFLLSAADRDVYAETEYPRAAGWHPVGALADARWKLILTGVPELYDVAADPGEARNLAAANPAIVAGMTKRIRQLSRPREGAAPAAVDAETAERLRALGYVSGSSTPSSKGGGPNPADVIQEWTGFERALALVIAGRAREAIPALTALVAKFPASPLFQSTLARSYMEAGQSRAAVDLYRAAVARHPHDAMLFHDLAVAARAAGDVAEALRAEQAALALDKDNPAALNGLGLVHVDAGRPADAAAAFERAASADRLNPSYWTNLGNARRELGEAAAAEAAYKRALAIDGNYADALNGLGVLLVQRGPAAAREAIPLLTRAVERAPDFYEARLNLGIAYQESGDRAKAAETYRHLLATAPPTASRERKAAQELLRQLR